MMPRGESSEPSLSLVTTSHAHPLVILSLLLASSTQAAKPAVGCVHGFGHSLIGILAMNRRKCKQVN
jgi:hypothetical protein